MNLKKYKLMATSGDFLEIHKRTISTEFWEEEFRANILLFIEKGYKTEILRNWFIADVILNNDKVLINWKKRLIQLTDTQIKEMYGRTVKRKGDVS